MLSDEEFAAKIQAITEMAAELQADARAHRQRAVIIWVVSADTARVEDSYVCSSFVAAPAAVAVRTLEIFAERLGATVVKVGVTPGSPPGLVS